MIFSENIFQSDLFHELVPHNDAFMVAQMVKYLPAMRETQIQSLIWEDPWRREWLPTTVFLPGKFHGQKSLAGYSPWDCKESDMTEAT